MFGFGPTNGVAGRAGGGTGVRGESPNGAGVYGTSTSGVGSIGISREAAGLYGFSTNSVGAYATSPNDAGLYGEGTRNAGVFGASPVYGVWGRTNTGFGVNGEAAGAGIGVYGKAGAGGFAGYFDGPVFIRGVGVLGSSAAPEATATQAASAQTVESFGEAQLVNGASSITVDQETVAAIEGGTYQVFLTPYGQHKALVVTRRGPSGFDVRAEGAPAEIGTFGWRVVAKAKPAARQAANADTTPRIVMPKDVPVPTAPELPTPGASRPERPAVPDAR